MTNNEELRLKALIIKQAGIIEQQTEMKNNFKKLAIQAVATAEEITAERDKLLQENIELHTDMEELQSRLDTIRECYANSRQRETELKKICNEISSNAEKEFKQNAEERDKLLQENIELHTDVEELQNRLDFLRRYFATIKYQLTWLCGNPNPIIAKRATRQLEEFEKYIKTYGE